MRFMIFITLLLTFSTLSHSKEINIPIDTQIEKGFCESFKNIHNCFFYGIESNSQNDKLESIVVYLNNYELLSDVYEFDKLLYELDLIARSGNVDAIILEASIYYSGFNMDRDIGKSISLLDDIPEEKINAAVYNLLGKNYLYLLESEVDGPKKNELYILTKEYLYKSHLMNMKASTRALAFVMIKYGGKDDFFEAGKLLEYLAKKGNESDIVSFEKYKSYAEKALNED